MVSEADPAAAVRGLGNLYHDAKGSGMPAKGHGLFPGQAQYHGTAATYRLALVHTDVTGGLGTKPCQAFALGQYHELYTYQLLFFPCFLYASTTSPPIAAHTPSRDVIYDSASSRYPIRYG
jgi:hypothetical protein